MKNANRKSLLISLAKENDFGRNNFFRSFQYSCERITFSLKAYELAIKTSDACEKKLIF